MISPETIARHELCGLDARVVAASTPDLVGIEGRVVDETTNTLRIEAADGEKTIPKRGATVEFVLPDGETVLVCGARLVSRPARRTEMARGTT